MLVNIWDYNEERNSNCPICNQYEKRCIEVAKSKWQAEFKDFDFVISNIKPRNKQFFSFGKVSSAGKNIIYYKIREQTL